MKIFDCFMYHNEDTVLDVRLNYLDKFVDNFIIVESTFNHRGQKKKLNFDIKKFPNFTKKINYLILDSQSKEIEEIEDGDSKDEKSRKLVLNGYRRDHYQRNYLSTGLDNADSDDVVIISDIDEIPNLNKINLKESNQKLIFFNQKMCYYKFNLYHKNYNWFGSRACRKKNLLSPQWLRDIKPKSYGFWRIDTFFSKTRYSNIYFVNDGGWHFSYLNTPELIDEKLRSYTHHYEYDLNPIGVENIQKRIENRESVYNLNFDQRKNKFSHGVKLDILDLEELPENISKDKNKFEKWLD